MAAYDGRFLKIRNDTVRLPNGNTSTREYVVHPGAVVVIPLLDDGRCCWSGSSAIPSAAS